MLTLLSIAQKFLSVLWRTRYQVRVPNVASFVRYQTMDKQLAIEGLQNVLSDVSEVQNLLEGLPDEIVDEVVIEQLLGMFDDMACSAVYAKNNIAMASTENRYQTELNRW